MVTYKPVGVDEDSAFPPRVEEHIGTLVDERVADIAPTQWQAKNIHIGERVESFMLRSADDGDTTADVTGFLSDTSIKGKRKLIGDYTVYNTPTMAAPWVDMTAATIRVMAPSKRALNVTIPNAVLEGGRFIGYKDDYIPSQGSAGANKHGIGLVNANWFRGEDLWFEDFGESAVYFTTTSNATLEGLNVFGIHGRPAPVTDLDDYAHSEAVTVGMLRMNPTGVGSNVGTYKVTQAGTTASSGPGPVGQDTIHAVTDGTAKFTFVCVGPYIDDSGNFTIPDNDARCRAFTGNNACFNNTIRKLYVERASIGGTTGVNTEGWTVEDVTGLDIMGQHLLYLQTPTRLRVGMVVGKGVARNVVKIQMAKSAIADRYGFVVGKIIAEDADCGLMLANTSVNLGDAAPYIPNHAYDDDDVVLGSDGVHYYVAANAGTSGSGTGPAGTDPALAQVDGDIVWYYLSPIPKFLHAGSVESVVATNCNKVAHISSVKGGAIGQLVGTNIIKEGVTLQNNEDLEVGKIVLDGTGWTGLYWRGGLDGSNRRVKVNDLQVRNPADPDGLNPTTYITGMYSTDADAEDIYMGHVDISDEDAHMDFGAYFTTAVTDSATAIPTMEIDGFKVRGAVTADIRFNTKPSGIKRFRRYDGEIYPINMPPALTGDTLATKFVTPGANQQYKIPPGATTLKITVGGAGGGAGSGRRGAAGTVRCAGGGGGGGAFTEWMVPVSSLPAGQTSLWVTVGAAGVGGPAVTADSTDGTAGTAGGSSYVITDSSSAVLGTVVARANGGNGGGGGTATTGAAGAQQSSGRFFGGIGGAASTTGAAGATPAAVSSGGPGGGSGGGLTTGNATSAGGSGGAIGGRYTSSNPGGTAPGGAGNAGGESPQLGYGQGGSGGASNTGAAAGAGGKGGKGAGGGGGGASENGFASGKGGDGGDGFVEIIAFF